jgi:hypothetical protein
MLDNKRASVRRTLEWPVLLLDAEGKQILPCTLVDISETGARLTMQEASDIPEHFTIVMARCGGPRRACKLLWRKEAEFGVAFDVDCSRPTRHRPPALFAR